MKRVLALVGSIFLCLLCLVGCGSKQEINQEVSLSDTQKFESLDYSLKENWVIQDVVDDSEYDLIFFYGTSVFDAAQDNGIGYVSDDMKTKAMRNYVICGEQLSSSGINNKKASVFVPAQRQIALYYALENCKEVSDLLEFIASSEAAADLIAAMDYYFENFNKNAEKPFVIAGHSQGSASVQFILENYFIKGGHKDYLKNMVAAYSTGYGVSEKWFNNLDKKLEGKDILHFATSADDYNCLLSWNTEGVGEKGESFLLAPKGDRTLLINPLNWKTDETYAGIELNEGTLIQKDGTFVVSHDKANLLDAKIDLERGSILCSTRNDFIKFNSEEVWGGKSLHGYDGKGYYVNMASNLTNRLKNFFNANK